MFSNPKSSTKSTPAVLFYVSESDVKSAVFPSISFQKCVTPFAPPSIPQDKEIRYRRSVTVSALIQALKRLFIEFQSVNAAYIIGGNYEDSSLFLKLFGKINSLVIPFGSEMKALCAFGIAAAYQARKPIILFAVTHGIARLRQNGMRTILSQPCVKAYSIGTGSDSAPS